MEVLVEWLQTFFDEPLPPAQELADLLTRHSFEVEEVRESDLGEVIVIDILPNRAHDCLSHMGIAREVAILLDRELKSPLCDYAGAMSDERTADLVELTIPDDGSVRRATKRVVQNVSVKTSPSWLQGRLEAIGQRSISNIVDTTNYVTFEMGQPVHAFDFDKIAGEGKKNVTIRYAQDGEKITLLDGNEYELDSSMLVIADDAGALDVAGIKGGSRAAIDENTKTVLLSVCNFEPVGLRKTSDKLKLYTDAAKRFKNEPTPEFVMPGIERLTQLVFEVSGGEAAPDVLDIYPERPAKETVEVSAGDVNALLGTQLTDNEIGGVLNRLMRVAGFEYEQDGDVFKVTPPFERLDLINPGRGEYSGGNKADIIEEIGRIVGYDTIDEALPELGITPKPLKSYFYSEKIREVLLSEGFSEVNTYSFVDEGSGKKHVRVENPIAENRQYLRHRISYLLNQKIDENLKNADLLGLSAIKVFEIGTVFTQEGEWLSLALGIKSKDKNAQKTDEKLLDAVLKKLEAEIGCNVSESLISRDGAVLEINYSKLLEELPEPKTYDDLEKVPASTVQYQSYSVYPYVSRDMAVWLPGETTADELEQLILLNGGELLKRVFLFDSFDKDGRSSYAYRLIFQADDRTLTDEEVNAVMDILYEKARANTGWEIR